MLSYIGCLIFSACIDPAAQGAGEEYTLAIIDEVAGTVIVSGVAHYDPASGIHSLYHQRTSGFDAIAGISENGDESVYRSIFPEEFSIEISDSDQNQQNEVVSASINYSIQFIDETVDVASLPSGAILQRPAVSVVKGTDKVELINMAQKSLQLSPRHRLELIMKRN